MPPSPLFVPFCVQRWLRLCPERDGRAAAGGRGGGRSLSRGRSVTGLTLVLFSSGHHPSKWGPACFPLGWTDADRAPPTLPPPAWQPRMGRPRVPQAALGFSFPSQLPGPHVGPFRHKPRALEFRRLVASPQDSAGMLDSSSCTKKNYCLQGHTLKQNMGSLKCILTLGS